MAQTSTSYGLSSRQSTIISHMPARKLGQRATGEKKGFLTSDVEHELEQSFASNMSLNSPPHDPVALSPIRESSDYTPMDISPAPPRPGTNGFADGKPLPRLFGRDMSNSKASHLTVATSKSNGGTGSAGKRLQRSALPLEWMRSSSTGSAYENSISQDIPSSPGDAMDVDTSFVYVPSTSAPEPAPLSAAPTIAAFDANNNILLSSPEPISAAPTITKFDSLFYGGASPPGARSVLAGMEGASSPAMFDESPCHPFPKKRRSTSPARLAPALSHEQLLDEDNSFDMIPAPSSPSAHKLERMGSADPALGGRGEPLVLQGGKKRSRRPALSTTLPSGTGSGERPMSAYPALQDSARGLAEITAPAQQRKNTVPPVRRAFSAMIPPSILEQSMSSYEDGSSFEMEASSPAQSYAKRQQSKTIRRCDGTEDFRPLTGSGLGGHKTRKSEEDAAPERDTPRSKYLGTGLASFGDNEALGKLLPCHRVREDGLMRISCKTLDDLLDGVYNDEIERFHIIDCRFDYEYNGGHIPSAVNINTTAGVEEYLLGSKASKPIPSTSGDLGKKTILIFHCEFSVKRAPTFAKHLRSKDRSLNGHVYPRIYYPEVYILEGGYSQYYSESPLRCQPCGYVRMDDPHYAASRKEDLDQFRKGKFGRTKSYAYGDGKSTLLTAAQPKRNTAPSGGPSALFAAANAARTRRGGSTQGLQVLQEGVIPQSEGEETDDLGDSPCPPPSKGVPFKGKKMGRIPLARAETYASSRISSRH
ncbi:hypothetical protein OBBRIDRAFT_611028 [Obba rivulosa]|uniref:M-phase inducer phosphatase n=1 Tax=Obba rivulosa TaxID=1052685 RepID=A0A8E2DT33_9APHY|nr:hypothetical protein OBBRIDRAFT_611028 [Obba rivulosa]